MILVFVSVATFVCVLCVVVFVGGVVVGGGAGGSCRMWGGLCLLVFLLWM